MKKNPYYDAGRPHHTPEGFRNPEPSQHQRGDVERWQRERRQAGLPRPPAQGYEAFRRQWWQPCDFSQRGDGAWWLGHASVLLRCGSQHILFDPIFSERASPLSFYGPRRKTPPPALPQDLPPVDWVLISHNHYDHLDVPSLRALLRRFPDLRCMAPLGLKRRLLRCGFRDVIELDWWDRQTVASLNIHLVPARHWSIRTPWDRNRSLWGGWVVEGASGRFYFSGDTGYSASLAQIARRLGKIDLAALPAGAYAPRWFMAENHIAPELTVRLFQELGCRRAFAMHWGVFELGDESLDEPPQLLRAAVEEAGLAQDSFTAEPIGRFIPFPPPLARG